jgi:hypothetical protein
VKRRGSKGEIVSSVAEFIASWLLFGEVLLCGGSGAGDEEISGEAVPWRRDCGDRDLGGVRYGVSVGVGRAKKAPSSW